MTDDVGAAQGSDAPRCPGCGQQLQTPRVQTLVWSGRPNTTRLRYECNHCREVTTVNLDSEEGGPSR